MKNTAIIIPARLGAKRFPNKPLEKINNIPMIVHVLNKAKNSKVGETFVATPDKEIFDTVKSFGGKVILTSNNHSNGTSRVYEAFTKLNDKSVDLIVNLQGDMPNIKSESIFNLEKTMRKSDTSIGTLASQLKEKEVSNENVVKVAVEGKLQGSTFLKAKDFFRSKKDLNLNKEKIYHHIGIYIFTKEVLKEYIRLPKSKLENERNLEQMRAMDNNIEIKVGMCESNPLSVDTLEDLIQIKKEMDIK
jgi:3-deoxy-manno-octulosonate cytidylyltransferase (CMP-KDO synthetase)